MMIFSGFVRFFMFVYHINQCLEILPLNYVNNNIIIILYYFVCNKFAPVTRWHIALY